VAAITVFLSFSLLFVRYWSIEEASGEWTWPGLGTMLVLCAGVGLEIFALSRSLRLEDNNQDEYRKTLRWFVWSVIIMALGLLLAVVVTSGVLPYWPVFPGAV
jgi:hypothetical protein